MSTADAWTTLAAAGIGLIGLFTLPPCLIGRLNAVGHVEQNYKGDSIVQSLGIVVLIWSSTMLAIAAFMSRYLRADMLVWLGVCCGFGLLGLLDDFRGDKTIKGLRGHLRAALVEHRITTGFVKAAGGGLIALVFGFCLHPHSLGEALTSALLIALSANAINLFDLRPGRAGAVFLTCSCLSLLMGWMAHSRSCLGLLLVVLPTLPVYLRDRRAQAMMGDTGSNLIGAALGLSIALLPSMIVRLTALLLLIALHVVAERTSITRLIERHPLLRALDLFTGVR